MNNAIRNNQTKPNQTQTTPIAPSARSRGGVGRGRQSVSPKPMPTRKRSDKMTPTFDHKPLPKFNQSDEATEAWATVRAGMEEHLSPDLCRVWFDPITCVGEYKKSLCLMAPGSVVHGILRAYHLKLGSIVRESTDFDGFFISDREAA